MLILVVGAQYSYAFFRSFYAFFWFFYAFFWFFYAFISGRGFWGDFGVTGAVGFNYGRGGWFTGVGF